MSAPSPHRIWRLRKRHLVVDAELRPEPGATILLLFYNGNLSYERLWTTKEEALADASGRRAELEREGWMEHW